MLLRFAVAISILFIFFIELNINNYIKNFTEDFESTIETGVRAQAWRNLNMMEHSIRADLKPYVENGDEITRELVFKMINDHGQSYIGSSSGNIFALDLEDNTLFYTNNTNFNKVKKARNKYFTEDDLYELTKKSSGNIDSVKKVWNNALMYKEDNPPNERLTWNVTGEVKWLVCKTLPSTTTGFNKHESALDKAFQVKICQTIEKRDILLKYQPLFQKQQDQKIFMILIVRGLILMFLLAVIADFAIRRYKAKYGYERRKTEPHTLLSCELCADKDNCKIYKYLLNENKNKNEKKESH